MAKVFVGRWRSTCDLEIMSPKKPSLRVFHMVSSFEMGGSEHQMAEVASRQKAEGYDVTVGCLTARGPLMEVLKRAEIAVTEFDPEGALLRPRGVYQMLRLTWFFVRNRFDVVQTHDLYSTLLAVPAAWFARIRVILSCRRDLSHWWWYTPRRRTFLRHVQNRSKYVIANSRAVADFLVKEDGFDPKLIKVIRNGVDLDRFVAVRADRQERFPDLPPQSQLIAVVANMNVETKGHTDLIRAAAEVSREFHGAKFLLVGDGVERSLLEALTQQLGLSDTVLFLGRRKDVPSLLACCDLFVLPSWAEGLPNSVLEAMAAGLPVVSTRVGGTAEIIEDGVDGLLVAPKDPHALAQAIMRILKDREFAKRMAQSARERARTQFGFDRLLAELDDLYFEGRYPEPELQYAGRRTTQ
jgi:glycosyltransferase involved in cell wall biosynthesis